MAVESGSIKVEGLAKTIKSLRSLGADKAEIVNINLHAAQTIMNAASPEVPMYSGSTNGVTNKKYLYKSSGALKASMRATKTVNYAAIKMGNARVPYANPIHWGWFEDKNNFIEKNIRPNPFLMRALKKNYSKIISEYDAEMQRLINKYELGETA